MPEPEPVPQPEPEPEAVPEPAPDPAPAEPEKPESAFEFWMIPVALGVFLIGGGSAALIFSPRKIKDKYGKNIPDYGSEEDEDEEDW